MTDIYALTETLADSLRAYRRAERWKVIEQAIIPHGSRRALWESLSAAQRMTIFNAACRMAEEEKYAAQR